MSIKSLIEFQQEIRDMNLQDALESNDVEKRLSAVTAELAEDAEEAQKVILSSISEKEFVKLLFVIEKTVASLGMANGQMSLLFPEMDGALQGYTHTVILSAIGALIKEEIL